MTGSVACADDVDIHNLEDFDVCFDLVDKDTLKRSARREVDRAVAAFLLSAPAVIDLTRIADPITFEQESGRPIFTFTPKGGLGFAYISSDPQNSLADDMAAIHKLLSKDPSLGDVSRLLRFSYEFNSDPYRAFVTAWQALETLISTVFSRYEKKMMATLLNANEPMAKGKYLARLREVAGGRHTFVSQFACIACQVLPETCDDDLAQIEAAKGIRDSLSHGREVDETRLPVSQVRTVVRRYMLAHARFRKELDSHQITNPAQTR